MEHALHTVAAAHDSGAPRHRHARRAGPALAVWLMAAAASSAQADVITQWNAKANEILVEAKLGTPPAVRVMAMVQTAVHDAAREAGARSSTTPAPAAPSLDAAVAAANRAMLQRLLPAQQPSIASAFDSALAGVPDGPAKDAGIAIGERAAAAVLAARADDDASANDQYRPHTTAGAYVPTAMPAAPQWPRRKPWLLASPSQFRPGPPPALTSDTWARDFNEIKSLGGKASTRRSAEQSEIARFWEYSLPGIYHGVVQSVALAGGRDVQRNARLFAVVSQAMDDALIGVFDAKYHHNFWRPVTAIRNGDTDGHAGTERDANWVPFVDTPMHPEYPCAHCTLAATVGAVLQADIGPGPAPVLSTTSATTKGATRRWNSVAELTQEVADARVYGGMHYRNSTEAGLALGKRIGEVAAARLQPAPH